MNADASSPERPPIVVRFDDGASVIVSSGSCFVQRRTGPLSVESVDLMSVVWRRVRRELEGPIAALFVIGEQAELPERRERDRQRALLDEIYAEPRFVGAAVVEGQGVSATLKRTLSRAIGRGRVQVFADVHPAARALAKVAGPEVEATLLALVAEARRLERG